MRKVDLKNKRFGKLLVIEECEAYISPKGYKKSQWLCKCNCGNYTEVLGLLLTSGSIKSCGCVSRPYSEQFMEEYLNKYNIDYICQYSFDDLIGLGNLPLKFDFAIFKNNKLFCLIELNGLQHYKPVKYFGGSEEFKKKGSL